MIVMMKKNVHGMEIQHNKCDILILFSLFNKYIQKNTFEFDFYYFKINLLLLLFFSSKNANKYTEVNLNKYK
jgi:hypothetical protein